MYYYQLAGLTVGVDGDWPQLAKSRLSAYAIKAKDGEEIACDVLYHVHQDCEHIEMPEAAESVEQFPHTWMKLVDGGYALVDRVPQVSEKIINCLVANEDWSEIHGYLCKEDVVDIDKNFRAFNVIGATLPYVLFRRGGMVLHSSCIMYDGQAVMFSAPSGTGKSTHTRLWTKHYPETVIINDDMPAIRMKENEGGKVIATAYGTPWAGKTQTNENLSAPVRAVVFLRQAPENSLRKVSGAEAAFLMMQGIKKPLFNDMMPASLDAAARLMELVPAYELSCNISREAVDLIKNDLFHQ